MGGIGMVPPFTATGQAVMLADEFRVPVIVRHSSPLAPERRPSRKRIDQARQPWPSYQKMPSDGDYVVTTTWRDVMDAAMTVGRDPYPWLTAVPQFAWAEIIARRSPLSAYLHRVPIGSGVDYQLEPNLVYRNGTERTARGLFGYRIGMTMAEWACRSLMDLSPTIHAESLPYLPGRGPAWSPQNSQPDLVGFHWRFPRTWLIEAKGYGKLGQRELRKGAEQLTAPGLMKIPHARVLCGTSIEHRVFMTIDVDDTDAARAARQAAGGPDPSGDVPPGRGLAPEEDDSELVALARSRMLMFHALHALETLQPSALSVRPVGEAVTEPRARQDGAADLVRPLENDESTLFERERAQNRAAYERSPGRLDMLTGRIPETGITIGMSRRLYEACRVLGGAEAQIWEAVRADIPDLEDDALDDAEAAQYLALRRNRFAGREESSRDQLYQVARQAFERGQERSWMEIIEADVPLVTESSSSLLESATTDTYLAIDTTAVP